MQPADGSATQSSGVPTGRPPQADAYRQLFEQSADALLVIEGDRFVDCNEATVKMLGYTSKQELLATHPSELSPSRQADGRCSKAKADEMMAAAFQDGSKRFEWDHLRADGEVFPVEVLLTAVDLDGRRVLHVVWRDITQRRQLEAELRQALKMEAVGKLAGGVAHDFNNLLTAILCSAELLGLGLDPASSEAELLGEITHAAGRAGELTAQLLAYSRRQVLHPGTVDLNGIVGNLQGMLARLIGDHIELSCRLAPDPVVARVDPGQVEQVLLNLVTNACDAMPHGGGLSVRTGIVEPEEGAADQRHWARLVVEDTGTGMERHIMDQIFDPFFTTKEVGEGTGLGLSTVLGIVRQSGGRVEATSELGTGSRFEVLLPFDSAPMSPGDTAVGSGWPTGGGLDGRVRSPSAPDRPRRSATILVVEDEPVVARLILRLLRDRGHEVRAACNGEQALGVFEELDGVIDLLITDVVMPGLGGPGLVQGLAARGHRPPVLYISGYTRGALARIEGLDQELDVLQKPFEAAALHERVEELLAQAGERVLP